jgi:hypothetical protein
MFKNIVGVKIYQSTDHTTHTRITVLVKPIVSSICDLVITPHTAFNQDVSDCLSRRCLLDSVCLFSWLFGLTFSQNCQKLLQFSRGEPEWGLEVVFNQQTESISRASYRTLCTLSKEYLTPRFKSKIIPFEPGTLLWD